MACVHRDRTPGTHHGSAPIIAFLLLVCSTTQLAGVAAQYGYFMNVDPSNYAAAATCVSNAGCMAADSSSAQDFIMGTCASSDGLSKLMACTAATDVLNMTGVVAKGDQPAAVKHATANLSFQPPARKLLQSTSTVFEKAGLYGVQWAPFAVGAPKAWQKQLDGTGVRIAVLDTPMYCDHQDLSNSIDRPAARSFVATVPDACIPNLQLNPDPFRHATHVAGIAAARGIGISGIAPRATIMPVTVLGDDGTGDALGILLGILYAAKDAKADVINLSLGGYLLPSETAPGISSSTGVEKVWAATVKVVNEANRLGSLVVVAAGNDAQDLGKLRNVKALLASAPSVVTVSATGPSKQWCPQRIPGLCTGDPAAADYPANMNTPAVSYTNFGNRVDLAAPGGQFFDTSVPLDDGIFTMVVAPSHTDASGSHYTWAEGTSMATPVVSGAAALVLQSLKLQGTKVNPAQLRQILYKGADAVPPTDSFAPYYGRGSLDVPKSLGL